MLCGFFASVPPSPSSPSLPSLSASAPTPPSSSSSTPSACPLSRSRTPKSWGRLESQTATGAPASSQASIPSSPLPCGSRFASARKDSPKSPCGPTSDSIWPRSEEHKSELQSHLNLVCRLLLEKKKHSQMQSHSNPVCPLLLVNTRHYGS